MGIPTLSAQNIRPPILRVTAYDRVRASLTVTIIALAIVVLALAAVWVSTHTFAAKPQPNEDFVVEYVVGGGGFADGERGQTLGGAIGPPAELADLESNPVGDTSADDLQVTKTVDDLAALTETGGAHVALFDNRKTPNIGAPNDGVQVTRTGTGTRGLGNGPGTAGGFSREQRWFIRFDEGETLEEYARKLDFFQIELGVLLPGRVLVYLTNLSAARPTERRSTNIDGEQRFYLVWQTQARQRSDEELYQRAGIDVSKAIVMHFCPPDTEKLLAHAERNYRGRQPQDIAKTFFKVRPDGKGAYEFVVTDQLLIK